MTRITYQDERPESLQQVVAANLRAEMAAQRLTTKQLASVLDVGERAAQNRLNGRQAIALGELDRIADWLQVSQTSLMRRRAA